ncbi:AraC family transcriptional regulator [Bacillus altitudinis]|uniref:AraC family transcriptional regulator n=1 Tax=Bacillus TaxID=1386 RepID=UPI0006FA0213|nr:MULTISPECIES: AraC family transcriptional regulator [Bacillus]KQU09002.1 transcriptional regulator [Bacillus sp. Leaf49]MBU4621126.1 AraC family transcriptional regulator [Bacillus sp. GG161]MBV5114169.1 AraC family transcriptional regulator [Bacillus altitudinis]MBW2730189.1 AraC family transcriptional regulator [Bacillus altitudinis]MCY7622021.1 AraC family transcriptional regulator [Bacillus altitudinis]
MDYYERIQHSIEFIEENLQNNISIKDISSKSCFSAFHFQRLFQAITGFSVQEYIRNRRLSEAARLLKETNQNILHIAIAFQYGSQEAFARAFLQFFGVTPGRFRKEEMELKKQNKMDFLAYQSKLDSEFNMNKPVMTQLNKFYIIGYEYQTNLQSEEYFTDIPLFYMDFGKKEYYQQIPKRKAPHMAYGVSTSFHDDGRFSFVVGEEVEESDIDLNEGFVKIVIPEGRYAEFKVSGSHEMVQNTRRYIYGSWLPNSNYERTSGPDFEITDVLHSNGPNDIKMKIYIPIEE